MKKSSYLILSILLLFNSCKKDEPEDNSVSLRGNWISTEHTHTNHTTGYYDDTQFGGNTYYSVDTTVSWNQSDSLDPYSIFIFSNDSLTITDVNNQSETLDYTEITDSSNNNILFITSTAGNTSYKIISLTTTNLILEYNTPTGNPWDNTACCGYSTDPPVSIFSGDRKITMKFSK